VIDVSNRASAHNGKVRYLLFDREAVKLAAGTRYPSLLLGTAAAVLIPGNLTGPDGTEAMLPAPTRNGTSYRLTEEKEQGDGWYPSDTHLSSFPYAIDSRSYAVRVEDTGEWRYYTSGNRVHIVGCSLLLPPAVAIDATFFPFEYLAARMLAHPDH